VCIDFKMFQGKVPINFFGTPVFSARRDGRYPGSNINITNNRVVAYGKGLVLQLLLSVVLDEVEGAFRDVTWSYDGSGVTETMISAINDK
jgi:hypothetical protein